MLSHDAGNLPQIRYIGFDHLNDARAFHFEVFMLGGGINRCTVTADVMLFLQNHVALQEGPALSARKLSLDLSNGVADPHQLTSDDLRGHFLSQRDAVKGATRKSRRYRME